MKASIDKTLLNTLLLVGVNSSMLIAKEQFNAKIIEKTEESVVTIHGQAFLKAYETFSNS